MIDRKKLDVPKTVSGRPITNRGVHLQPFGHHGDWLNKAPYWADLMEYDPVGTASELTIPMLFCQGERDYQITMSDFDGWKEGLAGQEGVSFKAYPELNHLFIAGTGKSTPEEYSQPGNVAQIVIDDIACWVNDELGR